MANIPEYQKYDYNADYEQAKQEQQKAQDAAYNSTVSELNAQSDKLSQQYDSARQQIYKNALISAQGAREVMAARGLTSSGVSETSNIRRQIALQNSLNQANLQEQNQKNDIAQKIIQAGYTRDQNMAQYLAQAILSKSNAQAQEQQYAASYDFNAWQAQQEADRYQAEFSYNKAMNEVSTFGRIITQEAADALGLPIGTSSYAVQQAEAAKKKVSSGGGKPPEPIGTKEDFEEARRFLYEKAGMYLADTGNISFDDLMKNYNALIEVRNKKEQGELSYSEQEILKRALSYRQSKQK